MFNRKEHLKRIANKQQLICCLECNKIVKRISALALHIKTHSLNSEEYYLKFIGKKGKCLNCKKETKFKSIMKGYNKFCSAKCNSDGEFNPMFGKKQSEKLKEDNRKRMIENNPLKNEESLRKNKESNKNRIYSYTPEHIANIKKHINALNEKGFINRGGKTKFYKVNDIIVQGRYELYFLLKALEDKKEIKRGELVKTPFGYYTPDFIVEGRYYEIKSTYTFYVMMKGKQRKKINWFQENISTVTILVLNERKVKEYLKDNNIKNFIHSVN